MRCEFKYLGECMMGYLRVFTLRDGREKAIIVEPWRLFKEEMNVLGIKDSDAF